MMRNPFHRKTPMERLAAPIGRMVSPLAGRAPRVVKSGLTAAGTFIGVSLASAAVSRARRRQDAE
jgi:hypothetical protein